jgi:hypothetical protein
MRKFAKWPLIAGLLPAIVVIASAHAADVMQTKMAGAYRVELHVLPAEPFFTKAEVADKHVKEGMEIEGGAAPVAPDAASHPNHHLIVHVFDKGTGRAVTDATVTMNFVALAGKDKPGSAPSEVPVVVMQAAGKGPASTHYGNNVTMPPGRYSVTVTVNGEKAVFAVTASDAPSAPMGHMEHMKM